MSIKIIHLSDLHIKKSENGIPEENYNFNHICDEIILKYKNTKNKPLIVITGDIVNSGSLNYFQNAEKYLKKLERTGFTIWPIPGNHDFRIWGWIKNTNSHKYFKEYILTKSALANVKKMSYPQIYSPAKGIYMIGLNSSNSIANIFMIARGYLAIFQRMSLSKQLKQIHLDDPKPFIIVFLHHHPFIFPDDRKHIFAFLWEFFAHRLLADFALRRILKNKVNIILFGHDHFHLDFSKTIIAKKFKVEHLLSCTQSTLINPCYDMNYDGTTNTNALRKKGFLGWEIEIANGKVKAINILKF